MAFYRYHFEHAKSLWPQRRIYDITFGLIGLWFLFLVAAKKASPVALLPFVVFLAVLYIAGKFVIRPWSQRRLIKRHLAEAKNQDTFGIHTFEFHQEFFIERAANSETKSSYRAIEKLGESDQHFFIYIGPGIGHILPKRLFPTNAEVDAFRSFITSRLS